MFLIKVNIMKKHACITILLTTIVAAVAIPVTKFKSWDDLISKSPEIIVARCIATVDFNSASNKTPIITDGMIGSDIEVVSVLKGNSKLGLSHMTSQHWPYCGEYLLVFANNQKDQFNTGYTAIEDYRVIPINRFFQTNDLSGKVLDEQIQLILNGRLKTLNEELARANEEKLRLETGLKKEHIGTSLSNNVPPVIPETWPPKGAKSF